MIKNKLLLASIVVFGLSVFAHQALASSAELLQPASTITYNEELVVNDTGRFDSIYIGKQDVGGVTFFNGTIVNNTTTDDVDNPVTFGDNVRIDGILFRTEIGGDNPLKIGDTIRPVDNNTYDLGTSSNAFRNIYLSGELNSNGSIDSADIAYRTIVTDDIAQGAITTAKILDGTIATADIADNSVTSVKIDDGTITSSDLQEAYVNFDNPSWVERRGYKTVLAGSLQPSDHTITYSNTGDRLYATNGSTQFFYANIDLPNGAIVDRVTANVLDSSGSATIYINLFRSDKEGSGYNMASLQSSGSSVNVQNLEETNIVYDTINNADYGYFFNVGLGGSINTTFYSLSIEYLYTEPN